MKINMAHLKEHAVGGGWISFAVFDAKSPSGENDGLLFQLTAKAQESGLRIDQSALAFTSGGRLRFYGDTKLVDYLAKGWHPVWTHTLDF
ncbi:hypothetical protein [Pseudomonas avellanae]|uniref:hypothetical protein n=1 Tax=Pseudomonas avellanae TaxID=46257 RepID=UPI000464E390|nr:hypothetical protein [Pseudomonas avellanae]